MILSIRCRAIFIFKNMNPYQQNHFQDGKMLIRCAPWIQRSPVGTAELLLARLQVAGVLLPPEGCFIPLCRCKRFKNAS